MTNITFDVKELNKFLDKFRKSKEQAEKEVAEIDEKYRKLAEKEKKELNAAIKRCQKEIDFWEKSVISRYTGNAEDIESDQTVETVEESEDVVVDPVAEEDDEPVIENENTVDPVVEVETINIEEEMEKEKTEEFPAKTDETIDVPVEEVAKTPASSDEFWAEVEDPWK